MQTQQIVSLKAPQIVRLFGWWNLKPYLSWDDVQSSAGVVTFRSLRRVGLTSAQLHILQPDSIAWVKYGGVTLDDVHEMTLWPVHPCKHLNAGLSDIITKQWTSSQMNALGLSLPELSQMGMEPGLMCMFGYPLSSWITLGLDRKFVENMNDEQIRKVFKISRIQVLHALPVHGELQKPLTGHALVRPVN
jgi:hypothetical protein